MNIFQKTRQLEMHIAGKMAEAAGNLVRNGSGPREPIEVLHAIVDTVENEIQPGGRGTRVFPFNTIDVSLVAASDHARARLEAIVEGDVQLQDRITERLRSAGCQTADLVVSVGYVTRAQKNWRDPQYSIAFSRVARKPIPPALPEATTPTARLELTVVRGTAERRTYIFTAHRIDFGRGVEVRDHRNGLIRTNQVAFADAVVAKGAEDAEGDVNRSVSRQHAHIVYEDGVRQFRLFDDGSVHGTRIVRNGRTLPVPWGGRGGRLRSGDEIALGEARVRVKFDIP
jgi:hypothetical protein